ncbi:MAG: GNAT family N-acetyltransferase [Lysobacterales bacterium]
MTATAPNPGQPSNHHNLQFSWARLDQLSGPQFHQIMAARIAVFVVEQNCPYQDADELDACSSHLSAQIDGRLAGYLRIVDPGCKYPEPSIGRVLTTPAFRGLGVGRQLMAEALRQTGQHFPGAAIRISAQAYLLDFYGSFGFEAVGEGYLEDGIPHWEMLRPARSDAVV